jgi:spermidine/putrescine transport system permease protein
VTITIYTRLLGIDANILKAATELSASEFRVFYQILLPLIQSNILAGWLLSFTLSLDDFILSFFLSGPEFSVLPLEVYSWVRLGIKPELNALCSILLCLTLGLVLISQILLNKKHD